MTGTQRRPPIFGPEPWTRTAGADWCHFDRWFAIVAVGDFGGDFDALETELIGRFRSLHGRRDVEAKLSHLADLRNRLGAAGIEAVVLAGADEPDKATAAKARRKVLDQGLEDRSLTPAMRTPSARLRQRALYGHWDRFPVDPDRWYEKLAGRRPATHVLKGRTFALTRQLGERLAGWTERGAPRPTASRSTEPSTPSGSSSPSEATIPTATSASCGSTRSARTWTSTGPPPAWSRSTDGRTCASCSSRKSTR